jgi:hypothetical protein
MTQKIIEVVGTLKRASRRLLKMQWQKPQRPFGA